MISSVQITFGVLLILIGSYVTVVNWAVIVQWLANRKHSSWVPLVGGLSITAGLAIVPWPTANRLWWGPLIADWGCVPGLVFTVLHFAWLQFSSEDKAN